MPKKPFDSVKEEVDYWEKKFKTCENLRKSYEQQWYMNLAFYFSKQWVVWQQSIGGTGGRLYNPPTPRNRVRLTANRVKPIVRDELTKLIKQEPQFYAKPNTTDPMDVSAARVAESLAEYCLTSGYYNRIRRQATFWMLLCGTGFIKTTCKGPNTPLIYERIPAFNMYFPNLEEEDVQNQRFVMHVRGVPPEDIEETYDIKIKTDMDIVNTNLEARFLSAIGVQNQAAGAKACLVKEIWVKPCKKYPAGAMLVIGDDKILYRYSPDGTKVDEDTGVETQGDDELPYDHGNYPFAKMDHTASGRCYGISTIEDIIPLQKEYNKTRSQIIEAKNRMAKPQMAYTKGSIDVTKVTSEVGLYIAVNPGFNPPSPIQIEPLPQYALEEPQRIIDDMDEIAGRNEISRGTVPTGIEAASAIAYLTEQNDSKIYNTVASIEEATTEVGKQTLSLINQFWDEEYIVNIVSKNNSFEATLFKQSNLNNNMDIAVEPGSMAPKSKAATQAFITDLMKNGLIPPEKGLRYLQMNETSRLYEELQADSKQAQRENHAMASVQDPTAMQFGMPGMGMDQGMAGQINPMPDPYSNPNSAGLNGGGMPPLDMSGMQTPPMNGMPVDPMAMNGMQPPNGMPPMMGMQPQGPPPPQVFPPNSYDNDAVHVYEHELFMKSQQYEGLSPYVKSVFEQHLMLTKQKVVQSQNVGLQQPGNAGPDNSSVPANGQPQPVPA
jgi:hypothetical protein